jgi:hypothetical protein
MFELLGKALGVVFERRAFVDDRGLDAWVILDADRHTVDEIVHSARPCYVVLGDPQGTGEQAAAAIVFAGRASVDPILRGRTVAVEDSVDATSLPNWLRGCEPLAFQDGAAVWGLRQCGRLRHHYVSLCPPDLGEGETLFARLSGARLARLLPLVLFVRALIDQEGWEPPPLQASFMVDDPNLHWPSYGFIDYEEMAVHAARENYHVAFATIPLDAWFVHEQAGDIFKRNTSRLSLLCHGNDHLSNELGSSRSRDEMSSLLQQALERIRRMEVRTSLAVSRVMAPPHGACSETAIAEMGRLGFEAVCVSRGSLRFHNPQASWVRTIGLKPCDMVAGLPVIPRFGLSGDCRNDILLAALLRQPIVPMTHHQGVADGYETLDRTASFVNSLGSVTWSNMTDISRALFARRQDDGTVFVRMFSRRVAVAVPQGATHVAVERPWVTDQASEPLYWRTPGAAGSWTAAEERDRIRVPGGATIEIASGAAASVRADRRILRSPRLGPVARRLMTEGRDRALPSLYRLSRPTADGR